MVFNTNNILNFILCSNSSNSLSVTLCQKTIKVVHKWVDQFVIEPNPYLLKILVKFWNFQLIYTSLH
jgi:hypothetical protein